MRRAIIAAVVPFLALVFMALPSPAGDGAGAGQIQAAAQVEFHGNGKSRVFHRPGCRYYFCKNCGVVFHSREEAIRAGYRPCQVCNP